MLKKLFELHSSGSTRGKALIVVGLVILVVAAVASAFYFTGGFDKLKVKFGQKSDFFDGFSKLILSGKNAQDNFDLEAVGADSLGIDADATFVLTSKDEVETNDIKNIIKITPEIAYALEEKGDKKWEIRPQVVLDPNSIMKISLATAYIDDQGNEQSRFYDWAFQVKDSFKILNSIPRDTGVSVPINSGIEVTFSHENFYDYEKYFTLEPKVEGHFEKHGRTLVFVPKDPLAKSQIYKATIKKGLPLSDSQETLLEDYVFSFETVQKRNNYYINTQDKTPWFYLHEKLQDFSSQEPPLMFLNAYNIPNNTLEVNIYPLSSQAEYLQILEKRDQYPWWSYSKDDSLVDLSNKKKLNSFQLAIESENNNNTKFIRFPQGLPIGYFVAEIKSGDLVDQVIIQISNASAYVNIATDKTAVWVADLAAKKPVSGAVVELLGSDKKYVSDGQGVAVFTTPEELSQKAFEKKENKRYYFKVSFGEESLIVPASYISPYYGSWSDNISTKYWQYFYTDRPLYQPTDSIKFWGLLKLRDGQNSADNQIKVQLYKSGYVDYYYRPVMIAEQDLKVDSDGVYSGQIDVKDLRSDYYYLRISVGDQVITNKYIQVRPYDKPAYSLTLTPEKKVDYAGNDIKLVGQAAYFEGTPVPDLALVFSVGNNKQKVTTDADGKVSLTYTKKYTECQSDYGCWPQSNWLQLNPESSELAEISSSATLTFYGPNIYATSKGTYPYKGVARLEIDTKKLDLNKAEAPYWWSVKDRGSEPAPNSKIEGEVTKITYKRIELGTRYDFINKTTYKDYRYESSERVVDNFVGVTDKDGKYFYERQVEPETSYRIKVKYYDQNDRYDVLSNYLYYMEGDKIFTYNRNTYDYYHLKLDKERFSVGEEVVADFQKNEENLPNNDNNYYLYLRHQNGLQDYAVTQNSKYSFYFKTSDIPNTVLTAVYFNGRAFLTNWQTKATVMIDLADKTMQIKVKTDKDRYRPGEEVRLSISTLDAKGQPISAAVNLNLIDEAFYAVMDDQAHPIESIYTAIGSGVIFTSFSHHTATEAVFRLGSQGAEKGCFLAGTKILLADGTSKNIEDIKIGDQVLTLSDPRQSQKSTGLVTEVYQHVVGRYLVINDRLRITPEHLVYTNFSFRQSGSLKIGDWLLTSDNQLIFINSIETKEEIVPVYNFRVEPQHTFFADGIFVHNEKGGGPREFFTDAALFQNIKTGNDGLANTSFKLPDNITSWRVTAQGVSSNIDVGLSVSKIPVSLPVFVEVTIGGKYLIGDEPMARLRSYGADFSRGDSVNMSILSPALGIDTAQRKTSTAFKSEYFSLPKLAEGTYDIIYSLDSSKGKDSIKLPLTAVSSFMTAQSTQTQESQEGLVVENSTKIPLVVVFSDRERSNIFDTLTRLTWSWGDRIDQGLARYMSGKLLEEKFAWGKSYAEFEAYKYQLASGGLTLLPYSSEDLELSARVAAIHATGFDNISLKNYFFKKLEDKKSNSEEATQALYGLSALGEPILPRLDVWAKRDDLKPKERLYLALAFYNSGNSEKARDIYFDIMQKYAQTKEPHIVVKISENKDETLKMTTLAAALAAYLNQPEQYGMMSFLRYYQPNEILLYLDELNYVTAHLQNISDKNRNVSFSVNGAEVKAELKSPRFIYALEMQPNDSLKVLETEKDIMLSTSQTIPITMSGITPDGDIGLRREYYVNGQKTNAFKENDIIEVRLYPQFKDGAIDGSYQITDILPSGLLPATKIYTGQKYNDACYYYPYYREGQKVKYIINKSWRNNTKCNVYLKYYARVKTKGAYRAEPAIIQSMLNNDYLNFSAEDKVRID